MSLFYFHLNDGDRLIPDQEGTDLPDHAAAHEHATIVAREIMRNGKLRSLCWRLVVCDAEHEPCFDLLFASVADNFDHLTPEWQATIRKAAGSVASLKANMQTLRRNMRQMRATLARADHQPYLAAVNGQRVDDTTGWTTAPPPRFQAVTASPPAQSASRR